MTQKTITISAPNGLHARPAGELTRLAKSFAPAKVTLASDTKTVNAASMLSVLSLGLKCGSSVTVAAEGGSEAEAVEAVASLLEGIKD